MKKRGKSSKVGKILQVKLDRIDIDNLGRIKIKDRELAGAVSALKSDRVLDTRVSPDTKCPQAVSAKKCGGGGGQSTPNPKRTPKTTPSDSMCTCVAGCGCGQNTMCNCA